MFVFLLAMKIFKKYFLEKGMFLHSLKRGLVWDLRNVMKEGLKFTNLFSYRQIKCPQMKYLEANLVNRCKLLCAYLQDLWKQVTEEGCRRDV